MNSDLSLSKALGGLRIANPDDSPVSLSRVSTELTDASATRSLDDTPIDYPREASAASETSARSPAQDAFASSGEVTISPFCRKGSRFRFRSSTLGSVKSIKLTGCDVDRMALGLGGSVMRKPGGCGSAWGPPVTAR